MTPGRPFSKAWRRLVGGAAVVGAIACSSPGNDGKNAGSGDAGSVDLGCTTDSSGRTTCLCYDEAHLDVDTFRSRLAQPDTLMYGPPTARQRVMNGSCDGIEFYWLGPNNVGFAQELVTNCAPANAGGRSSSMGFPADCMLEVKGGQQSAGPASTYYDISCVCCAGGECGGYCHPIQNVACASYNFDFQNASIGDPRSSPDCDCTTAR